VKIKILLSLFLFTSLLFNSAFAADSGFPGRAKFPEIKVVEKTQLIKMMNKVVIVDARSSLEFKTLRIKGAINIPVSSKQFVANVKKLREKNKKPIVFYCNGRTCMKSYVATKKSIKAKIKNVSAYDAGMFEWAKTYPKQAELFGISPVKKSDIIPSKQFKARLLPPKQFGYNFFNVGTNNKILDVRDKYQRGASGFFPGKETWISMDDEERLKQFISQARKDKKTLYIYDEVGKQVRWLQYALKDAGMNNFYFMKKGAKAYYKEMMKDMGITSN
jgi:rhodanese-related sulfurtransferase